MHYSSDSDSSQFSDASDSSPFLDLPKALPVCESDSESTSTTCNDPSSVPATVTLLQKYNMLSKLGEGVSGKVYRAIRKSDSKTVAIKFLLKSRVPNNSLAVDRAPDGSVIVTPMEVYVLRRLRHYNIIQLLDYFEMEDFYVVITEFHGEQWSKKAGPTDLFECIEANGQLPEPVALHILRQLVSVLHYLKSMNVYHMDIKDENIVIDANYHIKLVDFGSARVLPDAVRDPTYRRQPFHGTLQYAPPEVLRQEPFHPETCDMWSVGVVFYTMLHGQPPFASLKHAQICRFAKLRRPVNISDSSKTLLEQLLNASNSTRLNIDATARYTIDCFSS
jgi:serine/threonine protein kinase